MTLSQRIAEVRRASGLNKSQFGRLLGVTHSAVGQWESGETKSISYDVLLKIRKNYGYRPEWINEGKPPKLEKMADGVSEPEAKGYAHDDTKLPVISFVRSGEWDGVVDPYQPNDAEEWISWPYKSSGRAYVVRNKGLSMFNPHSGEGYPDGCYLKIEPEIEAVHGDDVIVRTPDGNTTFKQLQESDGNKYLVAINPDWPEKIIKIPEGSVICGVCDGHYLPKRGRRL